VRFACEIGRRDPTSPTSWQTRTDSMAFPRGDLDPTGRTAVYRFRSVTSKGVLEFAANCAVPYTEQALRRVDQHFDVRTGGGADQFNARQGSVIQGCVQEPGGCRLQAVDVIATGCTNPDWVRGDDGVCRSSRDGTADGSGSGGGDWGGGDGGGGDVFGPATESMNDEIAEQDTVPNCTQAQTTDWANAFCRSTAPAGARLDSTNAALNRMEQRGEACAELAREGRRLLSAGRLGYFVPTTGDAGGWGDSDIGVIVADYWADQYSGGRVSGDNRNLDHILSHEIDHVLGRDHTDTGGYETPNSRTCSGLSGTSP